MLLMAIGVALIVAGVTLLVIVDAPRRLFRRIARYGEGRRGRRGGKARPEEIPFMDPPSSGATGFEGLPAGWYRNPADPSMACYWDGEMLAAGRPPAALPAGRPDTGPSEEEELARFRGAPPGWYRDSRDPSMARYWNGASLSEERRPVVTSLPAPAPAPAPAPVAPAPAPVAPPGRDVAPR